MWLRLLLARARDEPDRFVQRIPAVPTPPAARPRTSTAPSTRPIASAPHRAKAPSVAALTIPPTATIEPPLRAPPSIEPTPARAPRHASIAQPSPETTPDWRPTACGGLLFLLPVLAHAGLVQRDSPEADRAAALRVLRAALRRLRTAPDDAAWALVDELAPLPPSTARAAEERALGELAAVRRWLHRHARLGLATLVRRPARIALTATHIDVRFPLSGADVRVRRLGLDRDPGWLSWFGRVIAFQFVGRLP